MLDNRIETLARKLVTFSCDVQKGENVLIENFGADLQLVNCVVREVYKAGGFPFVTLKDNRVERELLMGMTDELADEMTMFDATKMDNMQAYIGIRGGENAYELSDVPSEKMQIYSSKYAL
ncbi:MAG: aminopeptidase, partial [Clostridia bacterium]